MTQSTFTTTHVRISADKSFGDVTRDFENRLGKFDPTALRNPSTREHEADVRSRIQAMAGSSGLMIFYFVDHGLLLTLFGQPRKAIQYLVGNPLTALQMTSRDVRAALYAPLRVLIYQEEGRTVLEYDKPSSLFGHFDDPEISVVASTLDEKLEALVAAAIG